jgi:asperthecin polyketide synthase
MIIGHIQLVNGESPRVLLPLLSSETGNTFTCRNFEELSAEVVDQLLTRKIHVDNITRGLLETLPPAPSTCVLWSFKKSLILSAIIQKIEISPDSPQIELKDLVKWVNQEFSTTIPRSPKQAKLAIVGMSCRLPGGANDLELYWQLMAEGRNACSTVPPDRFDLSTHYDPTRKIENTTPTPFMNFMENPGFFDAGFFNMSPREALETDPMHRLALVTAYEALEMAGYSPDRTRSTNRTRIGTYYGQASDDYRELNGSQNIGTYAVPGGERGFANGRIQYFFKFSGPSFNIDAACSSSLAAVNAACSALWAGEADTVLAGGLNVITDPDNFCQLGNGHFLSTTGQCKVWDEAADGYCRADGVGCVVIKRLEDAEADNDNILGVILSAATNHNSDAASITQPHAPTQMLNYENVMFSAGVDPLNVSYVELHGTGTQVGDREESRSVAEVFAPLTPQKRRKSQKLLVGAVKSNIGHGEAAAGIASLIKVLLMYQNGLIPAHIGMKKMNPLIPQDLAERNMGLNLELSEWPKPAKGSRYAVVNNFGAHGGNTTLLLEDAPGKQLIGHDPRTSYPITISARSRISLKMNIEALIEYLDEHEDVNLGDLSYTLCARRIHHPFRVSSCVNSISDLRKFLVRQVEAAPSTEAVPLKSPGIAFVFTGQGSFYNGIGSDLYHHYPTFTAEVNRLNRLVESLGFPSVVPYIKGSDTAGVSPIISQLSIVVIQIALIRFWSSLGVQPVAVLGHSLGEFAAFVATGTLSEVDSIFLAGCRAAMVTKSCEQGKHKMLAVRASLTELQSLLSEADDTYEVSCINTENDTVISGPTETIENINLDLKSKGLKCLLLDVPFAFHSKQMDPILEPFERLAENATFKAPNIPVISPLLAECIFDGKTLNASYLKRATREVVDFVGALDAAQELGIVEADTIWMELGPHFVTGHFVKNILSSERVLPSLQRDVNNFNTIGSSLAWLHNNGVDVSWNEYYRPYETAHNLLTLKSYKWNEKNYWIPYLGTWTLDKALLKYNLQKDSSKNTDISLSFRLKTSLVHGILSETIGDSTASISTLSNMIDPAFLEAMEGHVMNGHGVATQVSVSAINPHAIIG